MLKKTSLTRQRRKMKAKITCPHCGQDITDAVHELYAAELRKRAAAGGKAKTEKKLDAQRRNIAKLNAGYTAEKRIAAAEKRRATMAAKKAPKEASE